MNWLNRFKKTRLVAIKNFDDELYRLVKTYASLEGRTISSIFEEAIRLWLENKGNYEEVRTWVRLEQAYNENYKVFREYIEKHKDLRQGYIVVCDGKVIGIFRSYEESIKASRNKCRIHSLIIKLPHEERGEEIELGFPW
ncbi:MAG: hypothetical protein B6U89_07250 [Desulfurococcales archaeon ex4484_58]|nr:MAG: hypothetical protein B6U89_07250 [Desulfurococcales archaeon ex4484_58]